MNQLRIAVIGAGRLGGFHAQKLANNPNVKLVAVVDPIAKQRDRAAAECHTQALADFRPIVEQIDAAVVAAPTRLHHELALELLSRGIHLLVEKPLCSTAAQAEELVRTARRHRVVLQVGHVERFNPAFAATVPHVGQPKYIEAVRASGFTFRSMDVGVVLDLMIHDIDLVLSLVGSPPYKVEAMGLSVLGGHEDVAQARLEFHGGCVAHLSASRVSYEQVRRMQIWSLGGFAGIDFAARKTTLVHPSDAVLLRTLNLEALAAEPAEQRDRVLAEHLRRVDRQHDAVDALALELDDFIESVRDGRPPRVPGEHGRDAVAVAEQILAQIQAHAWGNQPSAPMGPLAVPAPIPMPSLAWDLPPAAAPVS